MLSGIIPAVWNTDQDGDALQGQQFLFLNAIGSLLS